LQQLAGAFVCLWQRIVPSSPPIPDH
ncbi:uncharacterized protein METZ01_LOCUS300936, partial [marine metagenome]